MSQQVKMPLRHTWQYVQWAKHLPRLLQVLIDLTGTCKSLVDKYLGQAVCLDASC
jgi:hypothetical protein